MQVTMLAAARLAAKHGPSTAIVLAADLNSIPGSGVYSLVTAGHLPVSHPHMAICADGEVEMPEFRDVEHLDGAADERLSTDLAAHYGGGGADLRHPQPLTSAYAHVLGREPLFTNFTSNFIGTLDYVFGSSHVEPLQVLILPSEDDVRSQGFLPAPSFPSDHLSLVAKFAFRSA